MNLSPVFRLPTVTSSPSTVTVKPSPSVCVITLPFAVIGMSAVAGIVPLVSVTAETSLMPSVVDVASIVKASLAVTENVASFAVIDTPAQSLGNVTLTPSTAILLSAVLCVNV